MMSGAAGVALITPQSVTFNAGNTTSITAGHDINLMAQGNAGHSVKGGISLFALGKASNPDKPNQEMGIRLHAASGKVSSQSQSDRTVITADQSITVASTTDSVSIQAKEHVLLTAQGAYIKMSGGNIDIHAPGRVDFYAGMKSFTGPQNANQSTLSLPKIEIAISPDRPIYSQQFDLSHLAENDPLGFSSDRLPYRVFDKDGRFLTVGYTSEAGLTDRILTNEATDLVVLIGDGAWQVEEYFESDTTTDAGEAT